MAGKNGGNEAPRHLTNSRQLTAHPAAGRLIHSTRLIHTFIHRGIIET